MTVGVPETNNSSWRVKYVQKERDEYGNEIPKDRRSGVSADDITNFTQQETDVSNRKVGTPNPAHPSQKPFKQSPSPIPEKPKKGAKVLSYPRTKKPFQARPSKETGIETAAQAKHRKEITEGDAKTNPKYDPKRSAALLRRRLAESRVGQPVGGTKQSEADQLKRDKKEADKKGKEKPNKKPVSQKEADKKLADLKGQFKRSREERSAKRIKEQERSREKPEYKKWTKEESEKRAKEQENRKRGKETQKPFKPANLKVQNPNTQYDLEAQDKEGKLNEEKQEELRQRNRQRLRRTPSKEGEFMERPARAKDPKVRDEPAITRQYADEGGKERGRSVNPKNDPEFGEKKPRGSGKKSPPEGKEFERDVRSTMKEPYTERKEDEKGNVTHHKRNPQLVSATAEDQADEAKDKDEKIEIERPMQHGTRYSFDKPKVKNPKSEQAARKRGERKEGDKGYGTTQSTQSDSKGGDRLGTYVGEGGKRPPDEKKLGVEKPKRTGRYRSGKDVDDAELTNTAQASEEGDSLDESGSSYGEGAFTKEHEGEDKGTGTKQAKRHDGGGSGGYKLAKPPKYFMRDGKRTKVPESLFTSQYEAGGTQGAGKDEQSRKWSLSGTDPETGITAKEVHEATQGKGEGTDDIEYNEPTERKVPKGSKMEYKEVPQVDEKGKPRTYESQEVDEKGEKIRKPLPPRRVQQWKAPDKKKPKGSSKKPESQSTEDKMQAQIEEKKFIKGLQNQPRKKKEYMRANTKQREELRRKWTSKSIAVGQNIRLLKLKLNL